MTESVWEPLAEIEFHLRGSANTRTYCLCSRAFIRNNIESDNWEDALKEKLEQKCKMVEDQELPLHDGDKQLGEEQGLKKQEVEVVSCYCSASHYSTDDYESVMHSSSDKQNKNKDQLLPCALQNSDSGADLSETFIEKSCNLVPKSSQLQWKFTKSKLETAWEKYWSENGESIIWKSWIEKYGAYINPSYLEQSTFNENLDAEVKNSATKEDEILAGSSKADLMSETDVGEEICCSKSIENLPVLKISRYPSCGNLSDAGNFARTSKFSEEFDTDEIIIKSNSFGSYAGYEQVKFDSSEEKLRQTEHERVRSRCSNTNLSVRSIANTTVTTDSMTNVTKITLSSLDLSCEECESVKSGSLLSNISDGESSGLSSSTSSSSSSSSSSKEEICTEADMWWRKIWKEHYEDQYESSYQAFAKNFDENNSSKETMSESKPKVDNNKHSGVLRATKEIECSGKKVYNSRQYLNSVGYILSKLDVTNLNSEENQRKKSAEEDELTTSLKMPLARKESLKRQFDHSDDSFDDVEEFENSFKRKSPSISNNNNNNKSQEAERSQKKEKLFKKLDNIKQAMTLMGFSFKPDSPELQYGYVTYRKRNIRGQNRRLKLCDTKPRTHLFFDDDGIPYESSAHESTEIDLPSDGPTEKPEVNLSKLEYNFVELESLGYEAHSSSIEDGDYFIDENKKQKKRRKKQRKYCLPQEIVDNKNLFKYWLRRYQLFSKFDKGIKLDAESWYSVTPEQLAKHHAERCRCDVIIDAFCGAGGNSIQFAFTCERVIAIDIDPGKIKMAKHNAKIYGVEERIEFIVGDFVQLASNLQADVVFLSPPWGGPNYTSQDVFGLDKILPPVGGKNLFLLAASIANDVAYFLPKNVNSTEIALLSGPGGEVEIEQNFLDRRLRSVTAYFGELITDPDDPYLKT